MDQVPLNPEVPVSSILPLSGNQGFSVQTPPLQNSSGRGKKILRVLIIFFIVAVIFAGGLSSVAYAVAYEKLDLKSPELQNYITQVVMSLPFTAKTPKFILQSAALSHARVSKHGFDISLSAKPEGGVNVLGFSQFDVSALGQVDYTNPNDFKFQLKGSVTKEFDAELKKNGRILYIKINKIPGLVTEMFKIKKDKLDLLLENWIEYDTTPLESEASIELDKASEQTSITAEYVKNLLTDLSQENMLSNLVLTEEELDGNPVYKLHLNADAKTIDNFMNRIEERATGSSMHELKVNDRGYKPSDYLKDLNLDLFINPETNYVQKVVTTFRYNPNYSASQTPTQVLGIGSAGADVLGAESSFFSAGKETYSVAAVVKFDNFGSDFTVAVPAKTLKIEEFYRKLFEASETYSQLGDPAEQQALRNDAYRFTDLTNLQNAINVQIQETPADKSNSRILCRNEADVCSGNSAPLTAVTTSPDGTGWVKIDLSENKYVSVPSLPVDPVNNDAYHFSYCAVNGNWEINTVLESKQYSPKMKTDGGDNDLAYEVGSNLTLIEKNPECRY